MDKIWDERPSLPKEKAFLLETKYSGESFSSKLERLRNSIKKHNATTHIISTLDDIAWLFNIRGKDVLYNPVVLSYAVVTLDEVYLFVDSDKLTDDIKEEFSKENVKIMDYDYIYEFVKNIDEKRSSFT